VCSVSCSAFTGWRGPSGARAEPGKDVPATAGTLSRDPVWERYHARYAGYALLFPAFDMEMAFMYPWAVGRGAPDADRCAPRPGCT
jgi:NADH:ubiquinone oxidoreductase subunit 3 (subunit A)